MLTINGKKFAKTKAEFTNSLFESTSTCVGFYKKLGSGILLMDMQKNPRVFIVNNKHGERFFVTASRQGNGKIFYMFALANYDYSFLGLDDNVSISKKDKLAEIAVEEIYGK